jgi:hypothetical protein
MASANIAEPIDGILERLSRCIRGDAKDELLNIRAEPPLQERIDDLARRCDEGELTLQELSEYETYIKFGNFIAILQAKAKLQQGS